MIFLKNLHSPEYNLSIDKAIDLSKLDYLFNKDLSFYQLFINDVLVDFNGYDDLVDIVYKQFYHKSYKLVHRESTNEYLNVYEVVTPIGTVEIRFPHKTWDEANEQEFIDSMNLTVKAMRFLFGSLITDSCSFDDYYGCRMVSKKRYSKLKQKGKEVYRDIIYGRYFYYYLIPIPLEYKTVLKYCFPY